MNFSLLVGAVFVAYLLYLCFGSGAWSSKSKHFKLYKVLINQGQAPDFAITVLKGNFPKSAAPGILTYIRPQVAAKHGLKSHEIVGCLENFKGKWISENFSSNRAFKDHVHAIAAREIPDFIRADAQTLGSGKIRLIDDRVAPHFATAGDEHCIGSYRVENGVVVAYEPNAMFSLFSDQGPLELVESIRTVLYSEQTTTGKPQAA